jgi:CRP-like cAMP-binding protein
MTNKTLKQEGIERKFLSDEAIVNHFEDTRWAEDFDFKEVQVVANYMQLYRADTGASLVREGAIEAYLCLILKGRAKIVKETAFESNETKRLTFAIPGQTIGEISLLDNQPRSASVIATEPKLFLVLEQEGLDRLTNRDPNLALKVVRKLAKILCQRLRQTSGQLVQRE